MHHGKEIYLFFGKYQIYGIIGIIVSSALMGIIIYKVLSITKKNQIENYEQFIENLNINQKAKDIIKIIIQTFLLISFYVMIAGFSAYFSQELQIHSYIGTTIIVILCYIIFMGNIERLAKVNEILVPILILTIILLIFQNKEAFNMLEMHTKNQSLAKALWDAILYTSYNSIVLIPILLPLSKNLKQKSNIITVSSLCGIILAILAISIFGLLLKINIDINQIELPTVYVASMMGKSYKILYGIIILVSIYTSAISAGYGFLEKYQKNQKQYKKIAIYICIIAFLVANIGFTTLVNILYPICGMLGLIQIILIIKKAWKKEQKLI